MEDLLVLRSTLTSSLIGIDIRTSRLQLYFSIHGGLLFYLIQCFECFRHTNLESLSIVFACVPWSKAWNRAIQRFQHSKPSINIEQVINSLIKLSSSKLTQFVKVLILVSINLQYSHGKSYINVLKNQIFSSQPSPYRVMLGNMSTPFHIVTRSLCKFFETNNSNCYYQEN